jgi:hypothetical protein
MKRLLILWILLLSCSNNSTELLEFHSKISYQKVNIPTYIKLLARHYQKELLLKDSSEYAHLCAQYFLAPHDSSNKKNYALLFLLHNFFTSTSAEDGSRGPIVNIPYFWHWINPNPRHEIKELSSGKLLTSIKPEPAFKNYKSRADIDRVPSLFLTELFSENSLYTHPKSKEFSSFGWCSEREMAFSTLIKLYGFKTKVVANGNHSWSVHLVPMKLTIGKTCLMEVSTDNTFDIVQWKKYDTQHYSTWQNDVGNLKEAATWYNKKVNDPIEQATIKNFIIPKIPFENLDKAVRNFINTN